MRWDRNWTLLAASLGVIFAFSFCASTGRMHLVLRPTFSC